MSNVMEWTTRDAETSEKWGGGPWQNEPDKIQWVDDATGLDCLMHRQPNSGHWCGYVGVTEGHPYFEAEYEKPDVDVHGGLTYSDFCQVAPDGEEHPERGICHVPLEGRPHRVWWLGFDCAHSGDLSGLGYRNNPRYGLTPYERSEVYRDRAFVEGEVRSLASQLAATGAPE